MPFSAPSSGTILVVDDQEKNVQVVGNTLTAFNYEIMVATSGMQALTRVKSRMPDLILLDILMPEMDGFAVCAALKGIPEAAKVPIIFLSANDDKNVIVRALEAGGVDFLTKPFNKAELIARVRTHLELKHARDELAALISMREEFIGIMAHDLKNPIAGIQFSATLLAEMSDKLPAPAGELAVNIKEATHRTLDLIAEFLENIRDSGNDVELKISDNDLVSVVDHSVARFRAAADQKSISIHWNPPADPVYVKIDSFAAPRVIDNLISNAIKFTPPEKEVHVILEPGSTDVVVRDEGPGLLPEDRDQLFQQFTRLSAKPTGGETSTGLGLSIAHRLTELMGAKLIAEETSEGAGASFKVSFVRAEDSE